MIYLHTTYTTMHTRTIWFDFETGGLNPFHHPIIEIAAIDNMENRFESLLKIDTPLSPKVVELTKITDELLATRGADYNTTIREFHSYITKTTQPYTRTFMVAHNCDGFDRMFLKTALKKLGLSLPTNIFFLDSLHVARYLMPERTSFAQAYIAEKYRIDNQNPHRAMGDVCVLRSIWTKLTEVYGTKHDGQTNIIHIYNQIYM